MRRLNSSSYLPLKRSQLGADLIAGLTFAMVNGPQAIGLASLAGVNPVFGLYTLILATPVGALFTSSVFMNVAATSSLAVATRDGLVHFPDNRKSGALITLVLMIGLIQIVSGLLKMGKLMRFVAHSVMTGFATGVAILIILGQLSDLTGYESPFNNRILQLADLLLHLDQIDPYSVAIGMTTIVLILGLGLTRFRKFAMALALVGVTGLALVWINTLGWDTIAQVKAVGSIPRSLPRPMLPELGLIPFLVDSALAIAIIGLVQGAGVSQSYPNPNGKYPNVSRDFTGQGLANFAAGFFQGIPGGGSVSGTVVTVKAGARSRWSNIFAGLFVALMLLLFADLVGLIPMPALAGLLVVIGFQIIQPRRIVAVWQTNLIARSAIVLTLLATLTLPLHYAVFLGVAVSILLHVFQASNEVKLVQWLPVPEGFPIEQPEPDELRSGQTTVLNIYGDLFFAGLSTFEQKLPAADQTRQAVVILVLRGRPEVGSTFIQVLQRYSQALQANGNKLMLAGVSPSLHDQLSRTGAMAFIGEENLFMSQAQLGTAMNEALATAQTWLKQVKPEQVDSQ